MKKNLKKHNAEHAITKVIFRVWKDNQEVIALFPEVPADINGFLCSSYQHVGQHGAADYDLVISRTTPAKPDQYRELQKELETLGYCLEVGKKITLRDIDNRRDAAKNI